MLGANRGRSAGLRVAVLLVVGAQLGRPAMAWGPTGHQLINRLASANLPGEVPEFFAGRAGAGGDGVLRAGAGSVAESA